MAQDHYFPIKLIFSYVWYSNKNKNIIDLFPETAFRVML